MRAILILRSVLLVCAFAASCACQEDVQWLTWDDSREGTPPEVKVIQSHAESTTFEVIIHGFFMESIERETPQGTMQFSRIFLRRDSMSDYGTTSGEGKPEVPVIRRYIAVVSGAEHATAGPGAYEIEEAAISTIEGITVYPFQQLSSEQYPRADFDFQEKFYESKISYPLNYDSPPVLNFEVMQFHNLRVARVETYPFVCVAGDRVLRVYRQFRVRFEHPGEGNLELHPCSRLYDEMYSGLLANYDLIKPLLPPTRSERHGYYLIIVPDKYYASVLPLASWKRAKGLTVAIRTVPSQISNTAYDIRSMIQDFYSNRPGSDIFVLLVGDVEEIVPPTCEGYEWNVLTGECSSDIEYARVAGDDPIPDVFLGRIPADDALDVESAVRKILEYEKMSASGDREWLGKALMVAHKQGYPGGYTACKESIRSYPYSFRRPIFDRAYGAEGAKNTDVANALADGRGIVNYRGQGGADCWWSWGLAGQSWCISPDVANLTNAEKTPIFFGAADLTCHVRSDDCIGEELVELPQGGAVAYYGAAADSGAVANDYLDRNLFRAALDEQIHLIGAVANWAQIRTMEDFSGTGPFSAEYNSRIYLLLGDPEMSVRTRPPLIFGSVEHPQWVEAGDQSVKVAVKNANGGPITDALVVVRKDKGISGSVDVNVNGYTNAQGEVEFSISPAARGGLSVTVLKQDYVPYEGDRPLRVIHTERDRNADTFCFSWQIETGKDYAVYVSPKIGPEANWGLIGIRPTKEGLTMTVADTGAGAARSRFYRVEAR